MEALIDSKRKSIPKETSVKKSVYRPLLTGIFIVSILQSILSGCSEKKEILVLNKEELFSQAVKESLIPIQPGQPGKTPFWNINATRFIFAPAFNFPKIEKAISYHFVLISEPDSIVFTFTSKYPWNSLSPVWDKIPVGYVNLIVEGVDKNKNIIGIAGKHKFYRAAVFHGPYNKPENSYIHSAMKGLEFLYHSSWLQHWLSDGTPDPSYSLYCYPSKMIPAVIKGMIQYGKIAPENKMTALQIACKAADWLISISEPDSSRFAYFPPTYDSTHIRNDIEYKNDTDMPWAKTMSKKNSGKIMLIYPAEVAMSYLDLYVQTKDEKYFKTALNIASTYARLQDKNGRWPLLVDVQTGKEQTSNYANVEGIISLFKLLESKYNIDTFEKAIQKAEPIWKQKTKKFDFEGQFEDQKPSERYMNLANSQALGAAHFYFDHTDDDTSNVAKAEVFLRFAEDQFVVWEKPIPEARPGYFTTNWFIFPCALEQYSCYSPIDAHAASFISIYWKAYRVTGKKLYLAKAISLANSMTIAQEKETGRYPTWWMKNRYLAPGWINCAVQDAAVMYKFGKMIDKMQIEY